MFVLYNEDGISNATRMEFMNVVAARIVRMYLFQKLSLREIERRVIGCDLNGYFAKTILNFYKIDTAPESKNAGLYQGQDLACVIASMINADQAVYCITGQLLRLLEDDPI